VSFARFAGVLFPLLAARRRRGRHFLTLLEGVEGVDGWMLAPEEGMREVKHLQ
jgi:hypothetical protein